MKPVSGRNPRRALLPTAESVDHTDACIAMEPRVQQRAIKISPIIFIACLGIYVSAPYS